MDLYTHPGKLGDCLWSMATAKAVARGRHFDLALSPYCAPLVPLLQSQSYVSKAYVLDSWQVKFDAPVTPAIPPWYSKVYNNVYHLGMREWPSPTLAEYYPKLMLQEYGIPVDINFNEPWLDVEGERSSYGNILLSFSDEWAELKAGWILALLHAIEEDITLACMQGSRIWGDFHYPHELGRMYTNLPQLAKAIKRARLVITCNSVGHVLASAIGTPCIVAECSPPRQQPVFKAPISRNIYWDGINSYELIDRVKAWLS